MAVYPSESPPWPAQTSPPSTSNHRSKPRRNDSESVRRRRTPSRRQTADGSQISAAMEQCEVFSGNQIISCFPTSNVIVPQHDYAPFVWNSNRPQLLYTNMVDIYVFTGDSLQPIVNYYNQTNPRDQAGYITAPVNDTWFGSRGEQWAGKNISLPFYWVIQPAGQPLDGSEIPQATFTAVQTTYLDSVSSSMASASSASIASVASAAVFSSVAAESSASVASISSAHGSSTTGTPPNGGVQSSGSGSNFPKWAIGVIVVLGFLAILAAGILAFLFMRRLRKKDEENSNRGSMGSASPMMAHAQANSPRSPLLGGAGLLLAPGAVGGAAAGAAYDAHRASSIVSPDGASTISHGGSAGEGGPFSGADAAIMADAFRKALRKPDFAGGIEEGESPGSEQPNNGELMNRELAEEGRDIRSVESSRGVQVETMSDSGETAQDHY